MSFFRYASKCFACGAAMCFPGLSGASTASLLGIYGDMLDVSSGIIKNPKKHFLPFVGTALSVLLGAAAFYAVFAIPARTHPKAFLHAGSLIMAFSLPFFIRKSPLSHRLPSIGTAMCFISGILLPLAEKLLEKQNVFIGKSSDLFLLALCGVFLSISIILPGISFSYMLSFLGLYERLIRDAGNGKYAAFIAVGIGIFAGCAALSSVISRFMKRYPAESDAFITGFILSSLINSYI